MLKRIMTACLSLLCGFVFAETKMNEKVYIKDGKFFHSEIEIGNYKIVNRSDVFLVYEGGSVERRLSVNYCPDITNGVSGDSIDGEPIWIIADSSMEHLIVFPSDYAFEKILVGAFWSSLHSDSKNYEFDPNDFLYERFQDLLKDVKKNHLRVLRNCVYAFYGYSFKSGDLQEIFGSVFDYKPDSGLTVEDIDEIMSKHNRRVLDLIIAEEARR